MEKNELILGSLSLFIFVGFIINFTFYIIGAEPFDVRSFIIANLTSYLLLNFVITIPLFMVVYKFNTRKEKNFVYYPIFYSLFASIPLGILYFLVSGRLDKILCQTLTRYDCSFSDVSKGIIIPYSIIGVLIISLILISFIYLCEKSHNFKKIIKISFILILVIIGGLSYWFVSNCGSPDAADFYCLAEKALNKNNIRICDYAKGISYRCYAQFAISKRDGSFCGVIDNLWERDNCYFEVVGELLDKTLCDKINREAIKKECYRL